MPAALLAATFSLLAGCGEKVAVHVDCITTAAPAVECTVKQTQGKGEVEACWDFTVTCANGNVVKAARTCQKVKDGGEVKTTIAADKLTGLDQCGGSGPPVAKVDHLTIDGKAVTK